MEKAGQDMRIQAESVMQGLERRRKQAADNLADIDSAIAALTEQPKLLETLDVLRRVGI